MKGTRGHVENTTLTNAVGLVCVLCTVLEKGFEPVWREVQRRIEPRLHH
jgi:hypothetical protein